MGGLEFFTQNSQEKETNRSEIFINIVSTLLKILNFTSVRSILIKYCAIFSF